MKLNRQSLSSIRSPRRIFLIHYFQPWADSTHQHQPFASHPTHKTIDTHRGLAMSTAPIPSWEKCVIRVSNSELFALSRVLLTVAAPGSRAYSRRSKACSDIWNRLVLGVDSKRSHRHDVNGSKKDNLSGLSFPDYAVEENGEISFLRLVEYQIHRRFWSDLHRRILLTRKQEVQ